MNYHLMLAAYVRAIGFHVIEHLNDNIKDFSNVYSCNGTHLTVAVRIRKNTEQIWVRQHGKIRVDCLTLKDNEHLTVEQCYGKSVSEAILLNRLKHQIKRVFTTKGLRQIEKDAVNYYNHKSQG